MKNAKITRRSFLLGLAACSAAGVLTACKGSDAPADSASAAPEAPASSVSEVPPRARGTSQYLSCHWSGIH